MKKIAVNTVKSFLKENKRDNTYAQTYNVGGATFDVVFQTSLSVDEKSTFIKRVLSGCFDSNGDFRPEYVTPMIRATVIQLCTNIPALTLKNETDEGGVPALDLNGMNELYLALDMENIQNDEYQIMLDDVVALCHQALDWKRSALLHSHNTDSAIRDLLNAITDRVENLDTDSLLKYAGTLSDRTKNLDENSILDALVKAREVETTK